MYECAHVRKCINWYHSSIVFTVYTFKHCPKVYFLIQNRLSVIGMYTDKSYTFIVCHLVNLCTYMYETCNLILTIIRTDDWWNNVKCNPSWDHGIELTKFKPSEEKFSKSVNLSKTVSIQHLCRWFRPSQKQKRNIQEREFL